MTNCLFGWENWARSGTIAASAEVVGLGAGQMQNDQGATSASWQTPAGTTTANFTLDAGAAVEWGGFGIFNTSLSPAATVRWRVGDDATFATALLDSGTLLETVVAGYRQSLYVPGATVTARYMRCDIADPLNVEGLLRVAQLFAGKVARPARNFGYQTAFGRAADQGVIVTRGGQEFTELRFARRGWAISLPRLGADEVWPLVQELQRAAEDGRNVLFIPFPEGADIQREACFGRLTAPSAVTWPLETPIRRAWSATISERL